MIEESFAVKKKKNTQETMNECIVKGCTNKKHEGRFINDLCCPCYNCLTTGIIGPTNSFLGDIKKENYKLRKDLEEIAELSKLEDKFNEIKKEFNG